MGGLTNLGPFSIPVPAAFPYWTSSVLPAGGGVLALAFSFSDGFQAGHFKTDELRVWAVRNGDVGTPVPALSCVGFDSPFVSTITIRRQARGTIPVKMRLRDENGLNITDAHVTSPPVINVTFGGIVYGGDADDSVLEPVGNSNDGNQFGYNPSSEAWEYRLGTWQFDSAGTYVVDARSGNLDEYTIDPGCTGMFVRLP